MLAEKAVQHFVPIENLQPTNSGTVTATITTGLTVQLTGSGDGWSTDQQRLILTPETTPAFYQLKLELAPLPPFALVGAQIFRQITEEANSGHASLLLLASNGEVQLNLLHQVQDDPGIVYQLFLGIKDTMNNEIFWPDPTISFDPQAGPPDF